MSELTDYPLSLVETQNEYQLFSNLPRVLFSRGIRRVVVVGLACDYCVRATAVDAIKFGLNVILIREATRAVGGEEATTETVGLLERLGATVLGERERG